MANGLQYDGLAIQCIVRPLDPTLGVRRGVQFGRDAKLVAEGLTLHYHTAVTFTLAFSRIFSTSRTLSIIELVDVPFHSLRQSENWWSGFCFVTHSCARINTI